VAGLTIPGLRAPPPGRVGGSMPSVPEGLEGPAMPHSDDLLQFIDDIPAPPPGGALTDRWPAG